MAKPVFNRNLFGAKRQENATREFPDVTTDTYIAHLRKAYIGEAKTSGRLQASFGFQICDDDPNFPNQYIWNHIGLTDANGVDQEKGYNALSVVLSILRAPDTGNPDNDLEAVIGSKVRLDYTAQDDKHEYSGIKIKRLIAGPDGNSPVAGYKAEGVAAPEELDSQNPPIDLAPGMWIKLNTGLEWEIMALLEKDQSTDGKEYLFCKPVAGGPPAKICLDDVIDAYPPRNPKVTEERPSQTQAETAAPQTATVATTASPAPDELDAGGLDAPFEEEVVEEEVVEEEVAPKLEVGMTVSGVSSKTGKGVVGKIVSFEADGTIKVHFNRPEDGKLAASYLKPETVEIAA